MKKTAIISNCGRYRYSLTRDWYTGDYGESRPAIVVFVMLNPSIADAEIDDPTIRKCIAYAQRWGYTGIKVVNLYAYRATQPTELIHTPVDIIGPENDKYILEAVSDPDSIRCIAAWGKPSFKIPGHLERVEAVKKLVVPEVVVQALELTKDGQPRHPLYLKGDLTPFPLWSEDAL